MKINYTCKHCNKLEEYKISGDYIGSKEFNDSDDHISECVDTIKVQCPSCQSYNKFSYVVTIRVNKDSQEIVNY